MEMPPDIGASLVALLPRLRRYAMMLCRSSVMADDLVQGACLRALAHADSWTPGTRFDAWTFRILRNHWIDGLRQAEQRGEMAQLPEEDDIVGDVGEPSAMARLQLRDVQRAIDALPDEQREALLLVCVEDLSYREAADILAVPIGTIMSRLARARKRIADMTEAA
jgi:RNA polymerase sigma-70 factor, ECF subfamily